ncbi:MAG: FmdB family zinc ribbon protein [Dehalococcoidia bacterium]|jgi:putative FmdB family regulatory protein
MPTYQYQCPNCKLQFELKQSFHDKPIADCPACCGIARRLFSPVPILFKGPGFYVTDSRNDRESRFEAEGLGKKEEA